MIRLAADENFNRRIIRGIFRRLPEIDLVRVQDAGLAGADDPAVLQWSAEEDRVLLSHDEATMIHFAAQRAAAGLPMPGLFIVPDRAPLGHVIEGVVLLAIGSLEREWEGQISYLPL